MDFKNYPKPPIQEAILDIFTVLPPNTTLATLADYSKLVDGRYVDRKPRYQFSAKVHFNAEDSSKNTAANAASQTGWILRSPTKERAVQVRLDGFTFNRLPTYEGWAKFSQEARELWALYQMVAQPQMISSISLRYINRLQLPLPFKDFREYCLLFPVLPEGLPKALSEFLLRFSGPASLASGATSTTTLTFQPPDLKKSVLPLIIDVHVAQHFKLLTASDDATVCDRIELLRAEKNAIFESSITDAARKLFQ